MMEHVLETIRVSNLAVRIVEMMPQIDWDWLSLFRANTRFGILLLYWLHYQGMDWLPNLRFSLALNVGSSLSPPFFPLYNTLRSDGEELTVFIYISIQI